MFGIRSVKTGTATTVSDTQNSRTPTDYGFKASVIIYNRWGEEVFQTDDYQYDWKGEGLAAGTYFYEVTVDQHSTCKSWLHLVK